MYPQTPGIGDGGGSGGMCPRECIMYSIWSVCMEMRDEKCRGGVIDWHGGGSGGSGYRSVLVVVHTFPYVCLAFDHVHLSHR